MTPAPASTGQGRQPHRPVASARASTSNTPPLPVMLPDAPLPADTDAVVCALRTSDKTQKPILAWTPRPNSCNELHDLLTRWIETHMDLDNNVCCVVWHAMINGRPFAVDSQNYKHLPHTAIIQCIQVNVKDPDAFSKLTSKLIVLPVMPNDKVPRFIPQTSNLPVSEEDAVNSTAAVKTDTVTTVQPSNHSNTSATANKPRNVDEPSKSSTTEAATSYAHLMNLIPTANLTVPDASRTPDDTRRRSSAYSSMTTLTRATNVESRRQSMATRPNTLVRVPQHPSSEGSIQNQNRTRVSSEPVTMPRVNVPDTVNEEQLDTEDAITLVTESRPGTLRSLPRMPRPLSTTERPTPAPEVPPPTKSSDPAGCSATPAAEPSKVSLGSPVLRSPLGPPVVPAASGSDLASLLEQSDASDLLALDPDLLFSQPHTRTIEDDQFNIWRFRARQVNSYLAPLGALRIEHIVEDVPYTYYADGSGYGSSDSDAGDESYSIPVEPSSRPDGSQASGDVDPTALAFLAQEEPYDVERRSDMSDTERRRLSHQARQVAVSDLGNDGVSPPPPSSYGPFAISSTHRAPSESTASKPSLIPMLDDGSTELPSTAEEGASSIESLAGRKTFRYRYGLTRGPRYHLLDEPTTEITRTQERAPSCQMAYRSKSVWITVPNSYDEAVRAACSKWDFPGDARFRFTMYTTPPGNEESRRVVTAFDDWKHLGPASKIYVSVLQDSAPSPDMWQRAILNAFRQFWTTSTLENDPIIRRFARRQSRQRRRLRALLPVQQDRVWEPEPLLGYVPEALRSGTENAVQVQGVEADKIAEPPVAGPSRLKRPLSPINLAEGPAHKRHRGLLKPSVRFDVSGSFPPPPLSTTPSDMPCPGGTMMDSTATLRRRRAKGKQKAVGPTSAKSKLSAAIAPKTLPNPHTSLYVPTPIEWEKEARRMVKTRVNSSLTMERNVRNTFIRLPDEHIRFLARSFGDRYWEIMRPCIERERTNPYAKPSTSNDKDQRQQQVVQENFSSTECRDGRSGSQKSVEDDDDFGACSKARAIDLAKEYEPSIPPEHDEMGRVMPLNPDGTMADRTSTRQAERERAAMNMERYREFAMYSAPLNPMTLSQMVASLGPQPDKDDTLSSWISSLTSLPEHGIKAMFVTDEDFFNSTCPYASDHNVIQPIYTLPGHTTTKTILDFAIEKEYKGKCLRCWKAKCGVDEADKVEHEVEWAVQLSVDHRIVMQNVTLDTLGVVAVRQRQQQQRRQQQQQQQQQYGGVVKFRLVSRPVKVIMEDSETYYKRDVDGDDMIVKTGWKPLMSENCSWVRSSTLDIMGVGTSAGAVAGGSGGAGAGVYAGGAGAGVNGYDNDDDDEDEEEENGDAEIDDMVCQKGKSWGGSHIPFDTENGHHPVQHPTDVVPPQARMAGGALLNYFVGGHPWCCEKEPRN